jgi:sporadic carbohydrate cluster protein (TIGR04323 family)
VLEPIFGTDIAVQRYMNLRVLLPTRHEMIINFHTGLWYGHGMGTGTCWMPLTPCFDTNSMLVIDRRKSAELCAEALRDSWRQDKMQEVFFSHARPVIAEPGKAFLFNQEIIHGNVPNQTDQTRVSIDFRLMVRGGKIRRKLVGGYYVLLNEELIERHATAGSGAGATITQLTDEVKPQESQTRDEGYTCISYVNNNTRITSGIPIVLQRLMMRDYCEPLGLKYTYEQLELEVMPYLPTLQHVIEQNRPNEIVMYSVNALPENRDLRDRILNLALENRVKLHFANEDYRFESEGDRKWIDDTLSFGEIEIIRHEA